MDLDGAILANIELVVILFGLIMVAPNLINAIRAAVKETEGK